MLLRTSGSAWRRMRLTTLAGISSTMSTASSRYSSSSTSFSSVLEKLWMSTSCSSRIQLHEHLGRLLLGQQAEHHRHLVVQFHEQARDVLGLQGQQKVAHSA